MHRLLSFFWNLHLQCDISPSIWLSKCVLFALNTFNMVFKIYCRFVDIFYFSVSYPPFFRDLTYLIRNQYVWKKGRVSGVDIFSTITVQFLQTSCTWKIGSLIPECVILVYGTWTNLTNYDRIRFIATSWLTITSF